MIIIAFIVIGVFVYLFWLGFEEADSSAHVSNKRRHQNNMNIGGYSDSTYYASDSGGHSHYSSHAHDSGGYHSGGSHDCGGGWGGGDSGACGDGGGGGCDGGGGC